MSCRSMSIRMLSCESSIPGMTGFDADFSATSSEFAAVAVLLGAVTPESGTPAAPLVENDCAPRSGGGAPCTSIGDMGPADLL